MRAAALIILVLLLPEVSQAQGVCVRAQGVIAETSVVPAVRLHTDWDEFVESKPSDQPFEVQEFHSSHLPGLGITVVSCKMRTAERINASHYDDGSDTPPAGVESSCDQVHRAFLDEIYARVPEGQRVIPREQWLVIEEEMTFMGPNWLEPWPFVPVERQEDGRLALHTRALYAPHAWWIPMPARFLGNYYCHLAAPEFLEALVTGKASLD